MAKTPGARAYGNIRKLNSGKYQIRYVDPHGLSRTGRMTFTTKAMANRELENIRIAIEKGTWSVDYQTSEDESKLKVMTLAELAQRWRNQATKAGKPLAPKTLYDYESYITSALKDLAAKRLPDLTTAAIERWRNKELKRQKYAYTVKVFKHLNQLLAWAVKRKWLASNPCDPIEGATSYQTPPQECPTIEQVKIMLQNAPTAEFKLQLALIAIAGLRPEEMFALRRKDILLETRKQGQALTQISVNRAVSWVKSEPTISSTKTVAGVRTLVVNEDLAELLQRRLEEIAPSPEALLFHDGADPFKLKKSQNYRANYLKVKKLANYDGSFYTLRRFHLTEWRLAGATEAELKARGGHTSLSVAMRYQATTGREPEVSQKLRKVLS